MQHLSAIASIRALQTYANSLGITEPIEGQPQRKSLAAPRDNGTFVKPLKQSFIRNPRLMPGTRIALSLLAGWAGRGEPVETTLGIIGKHIGRSTRQVQRYLKDAAEEGYLRTSYVKDRIGRITGLRIHLTRLAIYHEATGHRKTAESVATTLMSDNKGKKSIVNSWEGWLTRQAASRVALPTSDTDPSQRLLSKGIRLLLAGDACQQSRGG